MIINELLELEETFSTEKGHKYDYMFGVTRCLWVNGYKYAHDTKLWSYVWQI